MLVLLCCSPIRSKANRQHVTSLCAFCLWTPCSPNGSTRPSLSLNTASPSRMTSEWFGKASRSASAIPVVLWLATSLPVRCNRKGAWCGVVSGVVVW